MSFEGQFMGRKVKTLEIIEKGGNPAG